MAYTISVIFCSSLFLGFMKHKDSIHSCQTEHCSRLLQELHTINLHLFLVKCTMKVRANEDMTLVNVFVCICMGLHGFKKKRELNLTKPLGTEEMQFNYSYKKLDMHKLFLLGVVKTSC